MKSISHFVFAVFSTAVLLFITPSCSNENEESISAKDLSLAQDEAFADALFEEVDNMVSDELIALDANGYAADSKKSLTNVCYTVTVDHPDSLVFPKVITLDYGDGCSLVFNKDTIVRRGQIVITVSGRWFVNGSTHTVSLNNFYINDVKIEGTRTRTNLGYNDQRHLRYGIELTGGKIIFNDTLMMTREASHVREIINHFNTQNDTIIVTGSAEGINVLGQSYSREIIEPLVMVHCALYKWRWIIADGKVELSNSGTGTTTIDYNGSGCDGEVIISKDGKKHDYRFKYNKGGKG